MASVGTRRRIESSGKEVVTHLYGQEINAETYAIANSDNEGFNRWLSDFVFAETYRSPEATGAPPNA